VKNVKNKKVFVGLSGGVDSAVSAALLKNDGYEVVGVFIKAWTPVGYPCTWKEDRRSAMKVAAILDIPFITLDLEKEYKKEVVDYMIAEYKIGRTPNPDIMCNKEIKFGYFLKFALKNGADFVATGHYCQKIFNPQLSIFNLKEGRDKNKDQSYFLWTLTQKQLKYILFPIGNLQKTQVRKLAKKFGLPQAERKDSQGLCFLGKIDMKEFLLQYIPQKEGEVLNEKGEIIGHHKGVLFFTIGERHGFIITKKTEKQTPLYIIGKNIRKNTITVAPKSAFEEILKFSTFHSVKISSKIFSTPPNNKNLLCRIRYRQEKIACQLKGNKVIFDNPQIGISAGQSLVLYDGEICLGGGIISQQL